MKTSRCGYLSLQQIYKSTGKIYIFVGDKDWIIDFIEKQKETRFWKYQIITPCIKLGKREQGGMAWRDIYTINNKKRYAL